MPLHGLARLAVCLFAISILFPIGGSLFIAAPPPRWLGVTDVAVAALFFGATALVTARAQRRVADNHRVAALRITQTVLGIVPVLLAVYFIAGSRLNWTVLVLGIAWRLWLLLYSLPFLIAALQTHESNGIP
jgi:hypothetical protein